jgi:hypothetical protein
MLLQLYLGLNSRSCSGIHVTSFSYLQQILLSATSSGYHHKADAAVPLPLCESFAHLPVASSEEASIRSSSSLVTTCAEVADSTQISMKL